MNYSDHFESLTMRVINCFDLDDNVLHPEFPQWEHGDFHMSKEASNDTYLRLDITSGNDEYEQEELDEYLKTGDVDYGTSDLLLNQLCERGLIDPGTYLIHIFW